LHQVHQAIFFATSCGHSKIAKTSIEDVVPIAQFLHHGLMDIFNTGPSGDILSQPSRGATESRSNILRLHVENFPGSCHGLGVGPGNGIQLTQPNKRRHHISRSLGVDHDVIGSKGRG
jgi:hypothetical protein